MTIDRSLFINISNNVILNSSLGLKYERIDEGLVGGGHTHTLNQYISDYKDFMNESFFFQIRSDIRIFVPIGKFKKKTKKIY